MVIGDPFLEAKVGLLYPMTPLHREDYLNEEESP